MQKLFILLSKKGEVSYWWSGSFDTLTDMSTNSVHFDMLKLGLWEIVIVSCNARFYSCDVFFSKVGL